MKVVGPKASVNATASLQGRLTANVFYLEVIATLPVKITTGAVELSAAGSADVTCTWDLGSVDIPTSVQFGPIDVTAEGSAQLSVSLQGHVGASLTVTGPTATDTFTATDGIQHTSQRGWTAIDHNSPGHPQVTPTASSFKAGLSATFTAALRVDVGVSVSAGVCPFCLGLGQANFVFAQAAATLQFQVAAPLEPLVAGYTGPSWKAGLEITAGPEISFSGLLPDLLSHIGITLPSAQWNLFDDTIPLAASPTITASVSDPAGAGAVDSLKATVPSACRGDVVEFVAYPKAGGKGQVVATGKVAGTTVSASWTVPSAGSSGYVVRALLVASPFWAVLPYSSAGIAAVSAPGNPSASTEPPGPVAASAAPTGPMSWTASSEGDLSDVSCVGVGDCWAVGSVIAHDTASGWNTVSTPSANLAAVTCVTSTDCWAVGGSTQGADADAPPLIEHYTGGVWGIVSGPSATDGALDSVTCVNSSACWAVGVAPFASAADGYQPLFEQYAAGIWSIVPGPSLPGSDPYAGLEGITCVSVALCWAVGYMSTVAIGDYFHPLIEEYTGSGWAVVSSPSITDSALDDVSCASSSDCWAVGGNVSGGGGQPLIEQYLNGVWSIVVSRNVSPSAVPGILNSVTCVGSTDCWAVGAYGDDASLAGDALVEHYSGADWSVPTGVATGGTFNGVSCAGTSDCWAVGSGGPPQPSMPAGDYVMAVRLT